MGTKQMKKESGLNVLRTILLCLMLAVMVLSITTVTGLEVNAMESEESGMALMSEGTPISLTFDYYLGSFGAGSIVDWMLKGDANKDQVVDDNDAIAIAGHYNGGAALTGQAFESGDINDDGEITSADSDLADQLINGEIALPSEDLTFRVSFWPCVTMCRIDAVSINGNALTVPEDYLQSVDTTVDGITYTVSIDKDGVVTVTGQCLAENDVYFTCKESDYSSFIGTFTADSMSYVYDGLSHEPGDIHFMRSGKEYTSIDQLGIAFVRINAREIYRTVYGTSENVYTDASTVTTWTGLTADNWAEMAQKTLDYFSDWNEGDKPEFTESGNYEYHFRLSFQYDPSGPFGPSPTAAMYYDREILVITKRPITITASTSSDLTQYTIGGDGLAPNQTIQSIATDTSTTGDVITNTVGNAVIIDADGNDVTANYEITYAPSSFNKMLQVRVGLYTPTYDAGNTTEPTGYYPIINLAGYSQVKTGDTATLTQEQIDEILDEYLPAFYDDMELDTENSILSSSTIGVPSDAFPDNATLNSKIVHAEYAPTGPSYKEFIYLRIVLKPKTPAPTPVISDPPTEKVIVGTPETPSKFTFVLTANDKNFPMPEGSVDGVKEMSIMGAGSVEFGNITFTEAGTYEYTISEKNTGVENYTYDNTTYAVTYIVIDNDGVLEVERTITANGKSSDKATFTNIFGKALGEEKEDPPFTADNSSVLLWASMMAVSAIGLCTCAVIFKKKHEAE